MRLALASDERLFHVERKHRESEALQKYFVQTGVDPAEVNPFSGVGWFCANHHRRLRVHTMF
jgi:hypothetical protein